MAIDWQNYLDGTMTEGEKATADALLARDEAARREFAGFKEFRAAIKSAGMSQEIPSGLETMLGRVAGRKNRRVGFVAAAAAVLIAAVFAGVWFLKPDPLSLARTPATEVIAVSGTMHAAEWVRANTGYAAPVLDLGSLGEIEGARYGEGWACYDYIIDGKPLFVYMSPANGSFEGARPTVRNGGEYFVGAGVGVVTGDLAFYVRGSSEDVRWQVIRRIEATTAFGNGS